MDATRAVKSKFGGCEIRLDFVSNPEFQSEDKDAEDDVVKAREDVRRCRRLLSKARDVHRSPREDEHPRWRRHAIVARLRITLWIMRVTFPREKTREKKMSTTYVGTREMRLQSPSHRSSCLLRFVRKKVFHVHFSRLLLVSRCCCCCCHGDGNAVSRVVRRKRLNRTARLKIAYGFYMFSSFRGPEFEFSVASAGDEEVFRFLDEGAAVYGMEKDLFLLLFC